ncbi:MocR-like pyridoxine biosynthesis transcription factor PdxR [Robertmurraya korlensis]|uniref:MocR-like pyridoxine biosynthesis transcription factor PdxR n=1 Tax=Robertmurraya korlensis TaxID=519977 RepID=UPI001E36F4D5|nr:PLP-dependent aminotransferase family protein [Robertmurraya korlensis]
MPVYMNRRDIPILEITLSFDSNSSEPLYLQLYSFFKKEIVEGRLIPETKLPSKRKLSTHLQISQTTVESAYQQLIAEGYVKSEPRKGLFVTQLEMGFFNEKERTSPHDKLQKNPIVNPIKVDFGHGNIARNEFPFPTWRKLTVQSLYEDESHLLLSGHRQGDLPLRVEIAKYLYQSRGVQCEPDQILIGAGTQYMVTFLTMLIGRDRVYSMENPGFHRTREAFKDQGVKLLGIELDQEGIKMEDLVASKASVTYVTPSHQFPMGMVMPISRRMELLKWAHETESYIIEDDYDGEFRYTGKPIPSLQGLDKHGRVIYLGTFSKSLIPSLRISFMVLPPTLLSRYQDRFSIYKQTVSRLHQQTLYLFMKEGHWSRHLQKMRNTYRKKQTVLLALITERLGEHVTVIGVDSGLHILLKVHNHMTESELISHAEKMGVRVYPTSVYYDGDPHPNIPMVLLGYGGVSEREMQTGIHLLQTAWELF